MSIQLFNSQGSPLLGQKLDCKNILFQTVLRNVTQNSETVHVFDADEPVSTWNAPLLCNAARGIIYLALSMYEMKDFKQHRRQCSYQNCHATLIVITTLKSCDVISGSFVILKGDSAVIYWYSISTLVVRNNDELFQAAGETPDCPNTLL